MPRGRLVNLLEMAGRRALTFTLSRRASIIAAGIAGASVCALAAGALATSYVTVTVEVDGVSRPYSHFGTTVSHALSGLGVDVRSTDHVVPALNESVYEGTTIVVRHAREVDVDINGQVTTLNTTAASLHDVLNVLSARGDVQAAANRSATRDDLLPLVSTVQNVPLTVGDQTVMLRIRPGEDIRSLITRAGYALSPLDRVKAHVNGGELRLRVQKVVRGFATVTEPVAFRERTAESSDLFRGESMVTTRGVQGSATLNVWQETVDGKPTHRMVLAQTSTTAPVDQVRSTGTKEPTAMELLKAGIDPKAKLEDGVEPDGTISKRYRAAVGSISSEEELNELRAEAYRQGIALAYAGEAPQMIAQMMVTARGWPDSEFQCLLSLWERESHWNPHAENPSSGAYGIPQALPGSKMASAGDDWQTNPATQITWGLGYIAGRYGSPCGAWGHSEAVGWY